MGGDLFLFTHLTVERCPFSFIYLGVIIHLGVIIEVLQPHCSIAFLKTIVVIIMANGAQNGWRRKNGKENMP